MYRSERFNIPLRHSFALQSLISLVSDNLPPISANLVLQPAGRATGRFRLSLAAGRVDEGPKMVGLGHQEIGRRESAESVQRGGESRGGGVPSVAVGGADPSGADRGHGLLQIPRHVKSTPRTVEDTRFDTRNHNQAALHRTVSSLYLD